MRVLYASKVRELPSKDELNDREKRLTEVA